jgi:serine protease Do
MAPRTDRRTEALGSGFLIDQSGYIVTNNHVIDNSDSINVTLQDGRELEASLVGTDPKTDLALLKVETKETLPALNFGDSDEARVGDWVLAIGSPFGLGGSATAGIISARGRDIRSGPYDDYLQIDAPINSGNSGGPVFNADGEVIGVNTAIYSPNGGNVGIGFAIPSKQVQTIVAELKSDGAVRRGWLGVQIQDIDEELASSLGLDDDSGALVADVVDDSPAAKADLRVGDVITQFGDDEISSAKSLSIAVADTDPSKKVPVRIIRDGDRRTLQVRLGEAEQVAANAGGEYSRSGAVGGELGLELSELTDGDRQQLGLPEDFSGVLVDNVEPNSSAADQGLRPGDVISRVGSKSVHSVSEAKAAIEKAKSVADHAALLVRRGDGQQYVSVAFS